MAINIGENNDKEVTYVNSPDINRVLFKNLSEGASADDIADAVNAWIEEHPEAVTTVQDGSILPVKLDSSNEPSDGYVLSWNATAGKFEWIDLQSDITELKNDLNHIALRSIPITDAMLTSGYYCSEYGLAVSANTFAITDFIEIGGCVKNRKILCPATLKDNAAFVITDITGTVLTAIKGTTASDYGYSNNYTGFITVDLPSNAWYVRTSYLLDNISSISDRTVYLMQIDELVDFDIVKENLNAIADSQDFESGNLWKRGNLDEAGFYDYQGTYQTNSVYPSSGFVDISDYDYIKLSIIPSANFFINTCFWDENHTFISGERNSGVANTLYTATIIIPDNAKYFTVNSRLHGTIRIDAYTLVAYKKNPVNTYSASIKKGLTGKKLSILGDSISTYAGYIPEGNENYYTGSNCGVSNVNQTWWKRVIDYFGMELCVDESYSGATISSKRDESYPNSSGVDRCENLNDGTTNPDVIIIYMGTNDFRNNVAIGDYDGSQTFPSTWATFKDAVAIMLKKVLEKYKTSVVYICTLKQFESYSNTDEGFPDTNNLGLTIDDYSTAIIEMSTLFGIPVIDFNKSGLNYFNLSEYAGDYNSGTGKALHPNSAGMKKLADRAIHDIIGEFTI